ncbi:MAG: hypothetical protein HY210_05455 [Candidatus Omnitrophica bacterium]|nr:hypothetical protein [Candidatus Omnitrophota bacterium]
MKPIPRNLILLFLAVILLGAGAARAEIIRLKSGQTIEGAIVERTEDSIKVDTGPGIPVTYYLDEIEDIPVAARTETPQPEILPTPAPEPEITQPPDAHSATEPVPVAPAPAPVSAPPLAGPAPTSTLTPSAMMQKIEKKIPLYTNDIASLPPWQAPRLSRDEYLEIQAQRVRSIEQEHINRVVLLLIESLTPRWRKLKDAHPLIRKIAESPEGLTIALGLWAGVYALLCFPLVKLSRRFKCGGGMAWVPVLQIFPLLRIAGKSPVWFLFFFFPLVNILAFLFVWMSIARRLQQPHWLGYLMLVPAVNVAILWYLALVPAPAPQKRPEDIDTGIKFE